MFNNRKRIKLLCGLIDDLALLASFKDSIKEAHAAFQDFADAFQQATEQFLKDANVYIRGMTSEEWEKLPPAQQDFRAQRMRELWREHASSPLLRAKIAKLRSNDPKRNENLQLIAQIDRLRRDSPICKALIDKQMRDNAQVFLDLANHVFPDWEIFESSVSTRPLANLEIVVRRILGKSRSAARQCDNLMRCAEHANSMISQTLQVMFPEAGVHVKASVGSMDAARAGRLSRGKPGEGVEHG